MCSIFGGISTNPFIQNDHLNESDYNKSDLNMLDVVIVVVALKATSYNEKAS